MARARRRVSSGSKARTPGWLLILFGLALGGTAVLLTQLVLRRADSGDGLAGLFSPPKPKPTASVKKPPEPAVAAATRPKFDFYTVLPEVETVLPDRGKIRPPKTGKSTESEGESHYLLQVGSFVAHSDADELKARLALNGLVAHIQKVIIEGRGEFHRVRLGPYKHIDELDTTDEQLRKLSIRTLRLKVKKETNP